MLEDDLLKLRFKYGSQDALEQIYEKYVNQMLTLAVGLLHDTHAAEDVVHDTFVGLAQGRCRFRLGGSLRGYLTTCVVNRVRDRLRKRQGEAYNSAAEGGACCLSEPCERLIFDELSHYAHEVLEYLPYEQREALILHVKGEMTFMEIAKIQGVSLRTAQGRYRYGLDKLRQHLNGRVKL